MIPSLVERNEQIIIEWLIPAMSSLSTDDKLLMIGLFCMTNYNEVRKIFQKTKISDIFFNSH
jgi:hypothetical protein